MSEQKSRNLPAPEQSIEIELSADEVMSLSRNAPTGAISQSQKPSRNRGRLPISLACTAAVLFVAVGAAYRYEASARVQPPAPPLALQAVVPDEPPVAAEPQNLEPVRFQNPFDKREVFEFPHGTSQQEAHDAVANLLLQRAMERRAPAKAPPTVTASGETRSTPRGPRGTG